jgi:hypothetical protein
VLSLFDLEPWRCEVLFKLRILDGRAEVCQVRCGAQSCIEVLRRMRGEGMTEDPRIKGVSILAVAGLLATAVVLFLFYGIAEPSTRSESFSFTAWFSAVQVILLFSSLIYAAIKDGRPGSVIPVNSATVVVTFIYNVIAALTILLFTQVLLPHRSSARTYYVICIAELGAALAYAILLQLVSVARHASDAEATQSRAGVDVLLRKCGVISSNAAMGGWTLDLERCSEVIRFSEGLRRNPALPSEVDRLLAELEVLTQSAPREPALGEATKLIRGIEALARRRN